MEYIESFLKPEWMPIVNRVSEMFTRKLDELRKEGEEFGKYLIGISNKPWNTMRFVIGSEKDYRKQKGFDEIFGVNII